MNQLEAFHPKDIIFSLFISPGIANTKSPLKIFEPIKVPATASCLPLRAKAKEAAIYGRLVPIAITV